MCDKRQCGSSGISRPTGIPRAGGIPRPAGIPQPTSGIRPPQMRAGPSGLRPPQVRPPQQTRPGPSGLRAPQQVRPGPSGLRPPMQTQKSYSMPPSPTSGSRLDVTAARSGGQLPRKQVQLPLPAASSTMRSSMDESFAPRVTSSRIGMATAPSRSFGFRPSVPTRHAPDVSRISRLPSRPTRAPSDTSRLGVCPSSKPPKPTEQVERAVKKDILNKSALRPGKRVIAKARTTSTGPMKTLVTPAGQERLLQKAVLEKKVERDEEGQAVYKAVAISNLNEDTGLMDNIEMGIQELDPRYPVYDGKEVVGVTSAISITPEYTTLSKDYVRAVTEIPLEIGMSPQEIARLIEEEKEDVNNTLKMIPPDLLLEPGKYEMKHRLQQMRLNTESVALLEQSITRNEVTADEAQQELSPEAMATVMYNVETGIKPESSPDQVFNSLFREPPNENFINLSSIAPGPLQDVVVPTDVPIEIHKEVVTTEMTKLTERLNNTKVEAIPTADIFSKVMQDDQKRPAKGKNNPVSFPLIKDEKSLWVNANLEHLVNIVGAEPVDVLDPFNLEELEKSGNLEAELVNGVEYFVETNPVQYINRVQLRGSQAPSYFPGYTVAVPDFPDLIKIVKTPDEVFSIAWRSVQPKYFDEDSMLSIMT